ncbi:MAG: hypothetical protein ACKV2U_19600 [Bryobacteraceae bacterium]
MVARKWLWRLLEKDRDAIVLHFASGAEERVRTMYEEIRTLRRLMVGRAIWRGGAAAW